MIVASLADFALLGLILGVLFMAAFADINRFAIQTSSPTKKKTTK